MLVRDFDFQLPPELIAQEPPPERGGARLLHMTRASGATMHARVDRSASTPSVRRRARGQRHARLPCAAARSPYAERRGRRVPAHRAGRTRWRTGDRGGKRCRAVVGRARAPRPEAEAGRARAFRRLGGSCTVRFSSDVISAGGSCGCGPPTADRVDEAIDAIGHVPLPPYIKRPDSRSDRERYQTVFAERSRVGRGADGRPALQRGAARRAPSGRRRPSCRSRCTSATARSSRFAWTSWKSTCSRRSATRSATATAAAIATARREDRRVIAVGTTTTRTLEAVAREHDGEVVAGSGAHRPVHLSRVRVPRHFRPADELPPAAVVAADARVGLCRPRVACSPRIARPSPSATASTATATRCSSREFDDNQAQRYGLSVRGVRSIRRPDLSAGVAPKQGERRGLRAARRRQARRSPRLLDSAAEHPGRRRLQGRRRVPSRDAATHGRGIVWGLGAHVIKTGLGPAPDRSDGARLRVGHRHQRRGGHSRLRGRAGRRDLRGRRRGARAGPIRHGRRDRTAAERRHQRRRGATDSASARRSAASLHDGQPQFARQSVLAAAARLGIPVTVHVAIGTDIIHMHPAASGAALGEGSLRDFRYFVSNVARLERRRLPELRLGGRAARGVPEGGGAGAQPRHRARRADDREPRFRARLPADRPTSSCGRRRAPAGATRWSATTN